MGVVFSWGRGHGAWLRAGGRRALQAAEGGVDAEVQPGLQRVASVVVPAGATAALTLAGSRRSPASCDLLGVLHVGGGLGQVPLLLVEESQLEEAEGDQVVVPADPPLAAHTRIHTRTHTDTEMQRYTV